LSVFLKGFEGDSGVGGKAFGSRTFRRGYREIITGIGHGRGCDVGVFSEYDDIFEGLA